MVPILTVRTFLILHPDEQETLKAQDCPFLFTRQVSETRLGLLQIGAGHACVLQVVAVLSTSTEAPEHDPPVQARVLDLDFV